MLEALHQPARRGPAAGLAEGSALQLATPQQQTDAGRVDRVVDHFGQADHALRRAYPNRHVHDFFGQFHHPFHPRATAGQHQPGRNQVFATRLAQLLVNMVEQLAVARLDHLRQGLALQLPRWPIADRWHLDGFVARRQLLQRAGVLDLDLLGMQGWRAQRHRDVAGHQITGDRDAGGVLDRAIGEHRDIGGAGADVDQRDSELLFVLGQHRLAGRDLVQDQVVDLQAAAGDALGDVLHCAVGSGNQVHLHLEPHTRHPDRLADAIGGIDHEALGHDVQNPLVSRNGDRACRLQHTLDIGVVNLRIADRDSAVRVARADVGAGDAGEHRVNLAVGHQLGFLDRALDRGFGRLDVDHHAALQPAGGMRTEPDDLDPAVFLDLANDGHDLAGADIETDDQ